MSSSKQNKIDYWKSLLEALFYANKCYTYTFPFLNTDVIPCDGDLVAPFDEKVRLLYENYKKLQENLKKQIPLARLGTPEDVANLCLFLVSEDADYITGQVINVDGGIVM